MSYYDRETQRVISNDKADYHFVVPKSSIPELEEKWLVWSRTTAETILINCETGEEKILTDASYRTRWWSALTPLQKAIRKTNETA